MLMSTLKFQYFSGISEDLKQNNLWNARVRVVFDPGIISDALSMKAEMAGLCRW